MYAGKTHRSGHVSFVHVAGSIMSQECREVERQTSACRSLTTFVVETAFMSQNACKHSDVLGLVLCTSELHYSWTHMLWFSAHQSQGLSVLSDSAVTHELG